uniref:Uncharacterized protein n=1 Tax=Tanacetum cinerariifolium TaxID=118510 RepID=A0A6L2LNU1_TANCI|nr:hypothetical protein [Tanacetum cinerariifolium]
MDIPNKHQLKFNSIKDAKSLLRAIEKRFGGNAATKKTQMSLLKQQYENFTTTSLEVLDQTFDRIQKLISQLKIHGESISQKDANQKFLRSLSPEWNTHTIVWRNKPEIDTLSLDDLYNNLKIYEPEIEGTSSSNTNLQNVAFVSSNSTSSINRAINTAHGVITASTQAIVVNSTTIDKLKEMDLKWQIAMLTMRARRFLKNTRRKFSMNGNETIGLDKPKVECYNCHKRGHFARECRAPRSQDAKHKESTRMIVLVETPASSALVSCDGLESYDWSDQVEDGLTNFALMAYSSTSSNSKVSTHSNCSSSCLENVNILKEQNKQLLKGLRTSKIHDITYKTGLESVEILDKCKTGLGYNDVPPPNIGKKFPLKPDLSGLEEYVNEPIVSEPIVKKLVVETGEAKASADKPKVVRKNFGYPIIEDWISDSEDEDESKPNIEKKIVIPRFAKIEFVNSKEQVKSLRKTTVKQGNQNRLNLNNPKGNQRNKNNMMSQRLESNFKMYNKACYVCGSFDHLQANCHYHQKQVKNQKMVKPIWNYNQRVNNNKFAKKTHSNAKRNMAPKAVLLKSGIVNTARQNFSKTAVLVNIARQVSTAHPKSIVNVARPMSHLSKSAHSTIKRPIHKKTTFTNSNVTQKVNTVRNRIVNIAMPKAVVNVVLGNRVNAVKASARWVWKPKSKVIDHGNPQQDLQDKGVINSGYSRHMTGNMSYLTDYKEIDGGYVAFGGNPKREKITGRGIENLVDHKVKVIRCDNGTEFKNRKMNQFCKMKGIIRQYSVARTPQQNDVAERRNRILIEAARTMLADSKLPTTFWAEAVNISCYVQNRVLVVKPHNKTSYELFKADEGFFAGYSLNSKAFRVFNNRTRIVKENLHIRVNVVGANSSNELPFNLEMPELEDISTFTFSNEDEDDGIDYDEVFSSVARIEAIRLFLAYASFKDFMVYKIDVKSVFLYRKIEKEVYVCQPPRFEDPDFPDKVYRMEKALYGLHQASRAWYLEGYPKLGIWYLKDSLFDLVAYTDSDYAGASLDRKSTTGGCQYLGCRLILWQCKKQTVVVTSIIEAEYIPASSCCEQKKQKSRKPKRKDTKLPQTSVPTSVVDEAVNEEMDDSLERAATTATSLDAKQDMGNISKTQSKATSNEPGSQETSSGAGSRCQEAMGDVFAQTRSERVSKVFNDLLLAEVNTPQRSKDSLKLTKLMELCTNLQNKVLDLETTKTTQAMEIKSLKRRVKKLENKQRSKTHKLKRLYEVGLSSRMKSFKDEGLGEGDTSKQGRIADIDANKDIYLVSVHNDEDMFGVNVLDGDEVIVKNEDVAEQAKEVVDDITLAKALMAIKSEKLKVDKVMIQELEQGTTTTTPTTITVASSRPKAKRIVIHDQEQASTPIFSSQQPKSQDKDRAKMIEEPVKLKKKNQIQLDIEVALKLQDEFKKEQRLAKEEDELTDVEKAKLFMEFLEKRIKFFATKRAEEKRNRPLTKGQQRSIMSTYLKNMDGWKLKSLKKKSFAEIQEIFDKAMKKKVEDDKESEELKKCLEIISDDVTIDATPLSSKSPIIVDYKNILYYLLVKKMYPLTNHTLHQMFNDVKLQVNYECEMAYELLRLVKKRLKEGYVSQ